MIIIKYDLIISNRSNCDYNIYICIYPIIVQDVSDFQCQVLNRDLWSKTDVRNIIEQHCVFWQLYRFIVK